MQDKQEHPVDQFIKKVVHQYEAPFNEQDWQALESRLDVELPVSPASGTVSYTTSNLITIASGVFLLWLMGNELSSTRETAEVVQPPQPQIIRIAPVYQEPGKEVLATVKVGAEGAMETQTQPSTEPEAEASSGSMQERPGAENKNQERSPEAATTIPPGQVYDIQQSRTEFSREVAANQIDAGDKERALLLTVTRKSDYWFPEMPVSQPEIGRYNSAFVPVQIPDKEKRTLNDLFYFGPVIAPEFNSVGIGSSKKLTGQVGVSLQYELNRWSIGARVLYNEKKYLASGEDYSPPPGYWGAATNGVVPEDIDGWCDVIDVPVIVGFNLTPAKSWNIIPLVGLSSYWLTSEGYKFNFKDPNPGASPGWSTRENSRLLFGVANLSVAARIGLGRNMVFQVEPYLKIPLNTVGWGKVDLYSTGTLITLSYKLAPP